MDGHDGNGWDEYRRLVLSRLDCFERKMDRTRDEIVRLREDLAGLKVKAGMWGGLAGLVPVVLLLVGWIVSLTT